MSLPALLALPPNVQRRLEQALRTKRLTAPFSAPQVGVVVGGPLDGAAVAAELDMLSARGITGAAVAAVLELVREQARGVDRAHLVWTGPSVSGLFARPTRGVFEELVGAAQHRIWLSSYAVHDGPSILAPLAARMDAEPALEVSLLLNIGRPHQNTTTAEDLVNAFAHRLWHEQWPGTRRPAVFYDPRAVQLGQPDGVLHAKALVIDERTALIGSANLTEAAFERNYEAGVLSRDRTVVAGLAQHFRALVDHGLVVPLPGARR